MAINTPPQIPQECDQLIQSTRTLILATASQHDSHASYAPFIVADESFYILISRLAQHTENLLQAKIKVGCMLIEDESQSNQIFARQRIMFKAVPEKVERSAEQYTGLIFRFKKRFGDIVDLLDSLPDFVLIRLKPENAVLVKGFGDAHQLESLFK